ncbi:hypothetical protein CHUAL_004922 [Chamberlinius hualienensis]
MGASGSTTRKITIVNDEQSGVIKVSDAVVRRLKGESEQHNAAAPAPPSTASKQSSVPQPPAVETPIAPLNPPPSAFEHQRIYSVPPEHDYSRRSVGLPYEELYQQAMHLRQERDEQIRRIDSRWRERVETVEKHNSVIENNMKENYEATVNEIHNLFPKWHCGSVCKERETVVLDCFKSNLKTSLNCAEEVRDFRHCVQEAKLTSLRKG